MFKFQSRFHGTQFVVTSSFVNLLLLDFVGSVELENFCNLTIKIACLKFYLLSAV